MLVEDVVVSVVDCDVVVVTKLEIVLNVVEDNVVENIVYVNVNLVVVTVMVVELDVVVEFLVVV